MSKVRGSRSKMMAEINITPFTDVVLVLLIIFMVTTPLFVQSAIKIKLPKATQVESQSDKNINIKIGFSGAILMNEKSVTLEQLEQRMIAKLSHNPDTVVVVEADKQLPYESVIKVLDTAKKAGAHKLALGVEYQAVPKITKAVKVVKPAKGRKR